jgi:hypothetical protein
MNASNALRFVGVGNMLDREYRNVPAFQWARELVRNGIEAGARTIDLGVEWQAVEAHGVYRRLYADDGEGMTRAQLQDYMRTLGKGSKLVGGPHDNYALGCRMTLLPWNPEGVVVISVRDGEAYMVKMCYDTAAGEEGEYVLEEIDWSDSDGNEHLASTVYPPYSDDEMGVDWGRTIPDFVREVGHGTVFVLLGRHLAENTFEGDAERGENAPALNRRYFNTRFWNLPEGVTLRCLEFIKPSERSGWPQSHEDTHLYQKRTIKGAREVVEYVRRGGIETVEARGAVELTDRTKVHWWLREPDVNTGGIGTSSGFIAVNYREELYGHAYASRDDGDTRIGASVYRQFGIGNDAVRRRTFLVIEPPEYNEATVTPGIAPSTGRADLFWIGAGGGARSIKPSDWAEEFADRMPTEIEAALAAAHQDNRASDAERQERLKRVMDRFSKRWRAPRAKVAADDDKADTTTKPTSPGTAPRQRPDAPVTPRRRPGRKRVVIQGRRGESTVGHAATGAAPARSANVQLGYPDFDWVTADDLGDEGMIAAWQGPSKAHPNGLVQLDETHSVIRSQIEYWQSQYPKPLARDVEGVVKDAYADTAVAKISHIHALAGHVLPENRVEEMLANPALSVGLVGLLGEDALITPRLGGLGAKRRKTEESGEDEPAA